MIMDYSSVIARAAGLIEKYGKTLIIVVSGATSYSPITGETAGADTEYRVHGVEYPYSQGQVDGTIIQRADRRFLVAALTTAGATYPQPTTGNNIKVGTTILHIVNVSPLNPGDQSIIYDIQGRA